MVINVNDKIYHLIKQDENLKQVLFDLGFEEILKPGRLETVGRFMTLKKGAIMRDIDLEWVKEQLIEKGYGVIDE